MIYFYLEYHSDFSTFFSWFTSVPVTLGKAQTIIADITIHKVRTSFPPHNGRTPETGLVQISDKSRLAGLSWTIL